MPTKIDPTFPTADLSMIKRMIPHRYPFLYIDRVNNLEKDKGGIGVKNVTCNEPFFQGHFPSQPIMPGVLVIEAMAQTAAVVVNHSLDMIDEKLGIYLLAVDNARFRKMVTPGDVLELHMSVLRGRGKLWKLDGKAMVEDKLVSEAVITAMWEKLEV